MPHHLFIPTGSAPLDELHTLRSQLLLLHNQLLYERYKREQHAVRNRRLLRRIINATALEEQNNAMASSLRSPLHLKKMLSNFFDTWKLQWESENNKWNLKTSNVALHGTMIWHQMVP